MSDGCQVCRRIYALMSDGCRKLSDKTLRPAAAKEVVHKLAVGDF
jgi:ribosomal protein L40E